MSLEQRLQDALHSADSYQPSPDLFARVARSVEEDTAHRRRVMKVFLGISAAAILLALFTGVNISTGPTGRPLISAWVLEVVETVVMIGVLLAVGPSIRRFGRNYADDVFAISEGTGTRFLRLLDIAYYLVFGGVILTSTEIANLGIEVVLSIGLQESMARIGRMLLIMGALHATTLLAMPVIGFIYSSLIWRGYRDGLGRGAAPPSPGAAQSARVIKIIFIVLAVIVGLQLLVLSLSLIGGLLGG